MAVESREIVVYTQADRRDVIEAVKLIRSDPVMAVTISEYVLTRSGAQNKLYWAWLTDCERTLSNEHMGNTKHEWHKRFKREILLNIYIRDNVDGMAETMGSLYEVKINCGVDVYRNIKDFVIDKISTTDANVKQFTEYLTDIQRFCAWAGIGLRTDSPEFKRAFGLK